GWSEGATSAMHYPAALSATRPWERGLPDASEAGTSGQPLHTTYTYPNENQETTIDPRGVVTTTTYDQARHVVTVDTTGPDQALHETYGYDADGHLVVTTRQQGLRTITTRFGYDILGRQTSVSTDNVAVDGNLNASTESRIDYTQYAAHTITATSTTGAVTTRTLDALGRTKKSETDNLSTDGSTTPIVAVTAYDLAGNAV